MNSETQTKFEEALKGYRQDILTHLKYIKEKVDSNNKHLRQLNGRVRKTEQSLSWIKGIGGTVTFVISVILAYFQANK